MTFQAVRRVLPESNLGNTDVDRKVAAEPFAAATRDLCFAAQVAHPIMFDDDDPLLGRVRELALAFPDAAEKVSHGHPAFYTTKVFAYYGGSVKRDGEWITHEHALVVLTDPDEREAMLAEPRCFLPAYLGPSGWLGVDLAADTDWAEMAELLDASYRRTAGVRRVARLDGAS